MTTCWPWKDVRLETYNTRIANVYADVGLDEERKCAKVDLEAEIEPPKDGLSLNGAINGQSPQGQSTRVGLTGPQCVSPELHFRQTGTLVADRTWWAITLRSYCAANRWRHRSANEER